MNTTSANKSRVAGVLLLFGLSVGLETVSLADGDSLVSGHWYGALSREGAIQPICIAFEYDAAGLRGDIDIPELGMFDEPLREVAYDHPRLRFRCIYGTFVCIVQSEYAEITGVNNDWGPPVRVHLKRGEWMRKRTTRTDVTFGCGDIRLKGTLVLPPDPPPHGAVVILHGSAQTGPANWTYRGLANVLAQNGIAALMYEKRPAASLKNRGAFDRLADDAIAAVAFLKTRPEIDASSIGLFGASQGGWIAPLAASRSEDVAFVIIHAGPAVSVWDQEVHRVKYAMKADGIAQAEINEAVSFTKDVFAFVRTGRGWPELEQRTKRIGQKSWASYVQLPASREDALEWRAQEFDPKSALTTVTCPVLAIFGENDTSVPPAENVALMKKYLKTAGNPNSKIVVLDNVGHGMELNRTLLGDNWNWPGQYWVWPRKSPQYYDTILSWIRQQLASAR